MQDSIKQTDRFEYNKIKVNKLNKEALEWYNKDVTKTKECAEKALEIAIEADYHLGVAYSKMYSGFADFLLGKTEGVLDRFLEGYHAALDVDDFEILCRSSNFIATYYRQINQLKLSVKWYLMALDYANESGRKLSKASIYNNLGCLFLPEANSKLDSELESEKAKYYFQQCIKIEEEINVFQYSSTAKINLILLCLNENELEQAKAYLDDVHETIQQNNDIRLTSHYYLRLASYENKVKNFKAAIKAYEKGIQLLKNTGESLLLSDSEYQLAVLYKDSNQIDKSLLHAEKSLNLAIEVNLPYKELLLYGFISELYILQKNFEKATEFLLKEKQCYKLTNHTEKQKQVVELEKKYQNELLEKKVELDRLTNLELTRSNQDLTNFAHVASHDLKAPVRGIYQFSQLLNRKIKDKLDPNEQEYLNFIMDNSSKLSNIIDDVLEFSKVNSQKINYSPVNLSDLLYEVQSIFSLQIQEKNIHFSFPEDLPIISIDRIKIKRVFQNVVGNAIKFYDQHKQSKITILYKKESSTHTFTIIDNGIGIFEPFTYLNKHSEYQGTGMGLALCKRLIGQHGGTIGYDSEFGEGTSFYVHLPFESSSANSSASSSTEK